MGRFSGSAANFRVTVGLGLLGLALGLVGCGGIEDLRAFEARAAEVRAGLDADIAHLERALPAAEPGSVAHEVLTRNISDAKALRSAADAAVLQSQAIAEHIETPAGPISELVGMLAPWLPEPVRLPLVLSALLAGSVARWSQVRRGLTSVVESIEKAKKDDEVFAQGLQRNASTLRSIQTPTARRLVDRVQARRGAERRRIGVA